MLLARLALAVALALTATTPLAAKDKAAKLEAAYVVMGAQGAVARVTIENAAKLNTLGSQLMIELVEKVEALATRENCIR